VTQAPIRPSRAVLATFVLLNVVPAVIFLLVRYQENLYGRYDVNEYRTATWLYLECSVLFCTAVYFGCRFGSSIPKRSTIASRSTDLDSSAANRLGWLGIAFVIIYLALGGYRKLTLLGSSIDAGDFRIIGFNDTNRILTALLEMARRVLIPFALSTNLSLRLSGVATTSVKRKIRVFGFGQLLGALVTLDRFPVLLLLFIFIFFKFQQISSLAGKVRILLSRTATMFLIAGLTTLVQYNRTDFKFSELYLTGWKFFVHRLGTVTSVIAVELSFIPFPRGSTPLFLQFSRLGAIFGRRYVGYREEGSIYVTPVGAVGDLWRNFGFVGVAVGGIVLGLFLSWLDGRWSASNRDVQAVVSMSAISLAFALIFGVVFSQGTVFQLVFIVLSSRMLQAPGAAVSLAHGPRRREGGLTI
jgi:hypothetical protein